MDCTSFRAAAMAALPLSLAAGSTQALDLATFDASAFPAPAFSFGDFTEPGAVGVSGGLINIDIMTDADGVNGLFGGVGADVTPVDFEAIDAQIEVTLTVDPLNVANDFRVVLLDNDGIGIGEEYQFFFDLTGATPGQQVTLIQPLLSPGPVFRQAAFGQLDGDMIQNYGLRQIQIQTPFGGTDRLKIDVESVKIVDPDDPTIASLTAPGWDVSPSQFTFGSFGASGAVETTSGNFVIDAEVQAGGDFPGTSFGGLGLGMPDIDFDASMAAIEVDAKLLANNSATGFRIVLGDNDGDDSGPGLGSEDFVFTFDAADFNASDFTKVLLPLGSGTESEFLTQFGSTNDGDGLQNFDLNQIQIHVDGDDNTDRLNIEIASVKIVEFSAIPGDLNGDGQVDGNDFGIFAGNFGINDGSATAAQGDLNGDGNIDGNDFGIFAGNFGAGVPSAAEVPEPASLALLGMGGLLALRRRRSA